MASLQDQNTVARRLILELREGLVRFFARQLLRRHVSFTDAYAFRAV
jgi:hypothetical protein